MELGWDHFCGSKVFLSPFYLCRAACTLVFEDTTAVVPGSIKGIFERVERRVVCGTKLRGLEAAALSSLNEQRVGHVRCFGSRLDDKPREGRRSDKMGPVLSNLGSSRAQSDQS